MTHLPSSMFPALTGACTPFPLVSHSFDNLQTLIRWEGSLFVSLSVSSEKLLNAVKVAACYI